MSFFSKVLGGIFGGQNNNNTNNNGNNNREEQTQPHSEATNAGSGKQLEAAENSNDDPVKPAKSTPASTVPPAQNKSKEESRKPRKKKSKDSKDLAPPNISTPSPAPSTPVTTVTVTPPQPQPPDTTLPKPSNFLDGSAKKRFTNIFKRTSKNPPENVAPPAGGGSSAGKEDMKIGVAPIQPHLPKDGKNRNKKPKKSKKATSAPGHSRFCSADDVFPEEFRNSTKQKHRKPTNKNLKPSKSLPNQNAAGNSSTPETTATESASTKESKKKKKKAKKTSSKLPRLSLPKKDSNNNKDKIVKELKEQTSADTEVTVEQSNADANQESSGASGNEKKDETKAGEENVLNKDDQESLPAVILDREEVNRLISELKEEDREVKNIIHDPWLPLSQLMERSNDIYSDKRARNNAAITYEKFIDYELCSSKENKGESGDPKKSVSINPKIDREHFDVQTRASIGKDSTEVIDHKAGTNHPDKN